MPPWLSDRKLGPMNTILVMNAFTLLVVLTIWLPCGASSVAALFVVVVLMGIGTGSFVPLGGKRLFFVFPSGITREREGGGARDGIPSG